MKTEKNPFFVLGLPPGSTRAAIEEEAQKLLGMLELGLRGATEYTTPAGPKTRTADDVRAALAELRDPARRLFHELAMKLPVSEPTEGGSGWPDAFAALGMGPRR